MVMCKVEKIKVFCEQYGDVILKFFDGMGGVLIFCVKEGDLNFLVIIEILINYGQNYCMVQIFVLDISNGDKCILVVDGEFMFYCLVCIFVKGEICGNLVVGGCGEFCLLSEIDKKIVLVVVLIFKEKGLLFVGLDVIGDKLIEINVISLICI